METRAIILHPPYAYLYNQGYWWELGDWIGSYRIMDVSFAQVTLEKQDGEQSTFSLPRLANGAPLNANKGSVLINAPVREILAFATRQQSLNFFLPSIIEKELSGFFTDDDWQTLIEDLCAASQLIWTRRLGSIVYEQSNPNTNQNTMIQGIDTKNRLLGSLLQEIADTVGLELIIFDDNLRDVALDLYLADQPWNEALDCLSIMSGFTWAMVPQANGPGQLVVTRD